MSVQEVVLRWYVVRVFAGFETRVCQVLRDRVKEHKLEELFGRILVPSEEVVEMRGGMKCKSQRKFYPGYVLVEMVMSDSNWHMIKNAPRVMGFLGTTSDRPQPLSDAEAKTMLQQITEGAGRPKPKIIYEPGEVVRITSGVFKDFNGVVEEVDYDKNQLQVAVLIFGRTTPVKLSFEEVEKE